MADASQAFRGRGADLNAALGNLGPFADSADDLLSVLDSQDQAVSQLVRDGGQTFDALSQRPDQLRGLIQNTESVFGTLADRDQQLMDTFRVLPTFLQESRLTLDRLDSFSRNTNDLITHLRPSARALSGTLQQTAKASPDLIRFFNGLSTVNDRSRSGFGALRTVVDDQLPPPLARVDSWLDEVIPFVDSLDRYKKETTAVLGNLGAATNAANIDASLTRNRKYLRTTAPLNIGDLASLPSRWDGDRTNAYVKAGKYTQLAKGLDSFITEQCSSGIDNITLNPGTAADFPPDVAPPNTPPLSFIDGIQTFAYGGSGNTDSDNIPRPACNLQSTSKSVGGPPRESTQYPHTNADR